MHKTPFTKKGHENLVEEQKQLKLNRAKAVFNLKTAREMGDLSENAAYRVARSKLSSIDHRLKYLNKVIDNAYIIEVSYKGKVDIGCLVTVKSKSGVQTYQIVNSHEANINQGKISYHSPVGRALMGKKINDIVEIKTPSKNIAYKIVKISII